MKLIVVKGGQSTGKTSSIKLAVKDLGIDFSRSPVADIQCITLVRVGVANRLLGVGSAGDDAKTIRKNLEFFRHHQLDFVLCACSALRAGWPLLEKFRSSHEADLEIVETRRVGSSDATAENRRVADEILRHIRGW